MFVIKLKYEYLTGSCDDQGRLITTPDLTQAYLYTKDQAFSVKAGDERLKSAEFVSIETPQK